MVQVRIGDAGVTAHEASLVRTDCLQLTGKERDGSCVREEGGGGYMIGNQSNPQWKERYSGKKLEIICGTGKEEQTRIKISVEESTTGNMTRGVVCQSVALVS